MLPWYLHLQTVRLSSLLGYGRKTVGPVSQYLHLSGSCGTLKNPHHCSKRVGDVDPGVVVNLHTSHHSHHGLGGYSKGTNGLRAAASDAFVC